MKAYEPTQLVAISRYQNYFPTLPAEIREDVYARMRELIEEEKTYCDKENYKHMAQILTSIAHGVEGKAVYNVGEMEERTFPNITSSSGLSTGAYNGKGSSGGSLTSPTGKINPRFQLSVRSDAKTDREMLEDAKAEGRRKSGRKNVTPPGRIASSRSSGSWGNGTKATTMIARAASGRGCTCTPNRGSCTAMPPCLRSKRAGGISANRLRCWSM